MSYRTPDRGWRLLSTHGQVLVAIAADPQARFQELAQACGVTERTAQAIVADLAGAGYLTRNREGRRNRYTVHPEAPLIHPGPGTHQVGPVLDLLACEPASEDSLPPHCEV